MNIYLKPNSNTSGFAHIFLLIVIVIVGITGIGYLAYKNVQQNSAKPQFDSNNSSVNTSSNNSWVGYTNKKGSYSFMYPQNYKLLENKVLSVDGVEIQSNNSTTLVSPYINTAENNFTMTITHYKNPIKFEEVISCDFNGQVEKQEYVLADKTALFLENTPCGPFGSTIIFLKDESLTYKIEIETQATYKDVKMLTDQILSTFEFLDQSNPSETSAEEDEFSDQPKITTPLPNSMVSSPLVVKGTVPPGWMFEGSFPIKIVDEDKNLIVQSFATESEPGTWMSGEPTEFETTLNFSTSAKSGFLILEKDNPSGLPENSDSFEIPIRF